MSEFWESHFQKEGPSWGYEPADSALYASDLFQRKGYHSVLIAGIGYGRNALPFIDRGMGVSGIEISKSAIDLLNKSFPMVKTIHGSILDMPFNDLLYDGIYGYALIHLFNFHQRKKVIARCYQQLRSGGTMIFSVISPESEILKTGRKNGKNRRLMKNGLNVFFYHDVDIHKEFRNVGLTEIINMEEPVKFMVGEPAMKFKMIICTKL
jgi:SAM-dependent methyltransferase